jgi:hypothetical protein
MRSVCIACWISVPLIFSSEDSAPGAPPAATCDSTRRSVNSSAISSISTSERRFWNSGSSIRRRPPLTSRSASLTHLTQRALGVGDTGDTRALVCQQRLGIGPALVLLADQVFDRHANVVELHLVQAVVVVDGLDRVDLDALGLHVDEQEADTVLLLALAAGAHEAEDPVRVLRIGGPDLGSVDHVVIAIQLGPGLQGGEVGAGAGLRVALAPPVLALEDARQEALLLLLVTEGVDHRRHHLQAEGHHVADTAGRTLALINDSSASASSPRRRAPRASSGQPSPFRRASAATRRWHPVLPCRHARPQIVV